VHFLIVDDVYDKRWARWFYRWMRTIPVSNDTGKPLFAMREAMRRLRSGEVIGIFPEGRVFSRDQPGQTGHERAEDLIGRIETALDERP